MNREITVDRLKEHVYTLAAEIGERNVFRPKGLEEAEKYIIRTWREQGYVVNRQTYMTHGVECANLEVTCSGSSESDEIIVIGAHYDSVIECPGANDNGTGVAALLEISRLFARSDPTISVRFVAFVNEEPPFFYWGKMGSGVYAKAARERGDRIRFMVSLETIGYYSDKPGSQHYPPFFKYFYPEQGNFIAFVSNLRSRGAMRRAAHAFREGSDFPLQHVATFSWVPGVSWSDQLCFWKQGYRAFMVTDTALYRYRYYHTPEDTADRVCYEPYAQCCNGLYRCFNRLARER
jgi:Zn-dependent M28 family amino/carboxypeptidase